MLTCVRLVALGVDACPSEAIFEQDDVYAIDPDRCNDCGACEDECPNEAISAD
ncbi:MAG: 4Fe-4S binding protein [Gammaproteobacteria bacterium]|nr:4Fe-4S binding protein [Gammaproteobacteria bacterium]